MRLVLSNNFCDELQLELNQPLSQLRPISESTVIIMDVKIRKN